MNDKPRLPRHASDQEFYERLEAARAARAARPKCLICHKPIGSKTCKPFRQRTRGRPVYQSRHNLLMRQLQP